MHEKKDKILLLAFVTGWSNQNIGNTHAWIQKLSNYKPTQFFNFGSGEIKSFLNEGY